MGSSIGFMLSLVFMIQILGFAGDLTSVQAINAQLDALAMTASKRIALSGSIDAELRDYVESKKAYIVSLNGDKPIQIGSIYRFKVYRSYRPLIISSSLMELSVERSTVVGYLD